MRVPSPDQAATSVSPETIVRAPLPSAFMTVSAKPPTASRFPFGAQAAYPPAATRWASLPSAATIQIDGAELSSLTRTKETSRPSGDHDACVSRSGPLVSRLKPVPSAFMTKTSKSCRVSRPRPSRTSWCPSEEKSARLAEKSFVNRRWCVPFGFMTKTCARPPKARSLQNEILPFRTLPGAVRSERPTAAVSVAARPSTRVTRTRRCMAASWSNARPTPRPATWFRHIPANCCSLPARDVGSPRHHRQGRGSHAPEEFASAARCDRDGHDAHFWRHGRRRRRKRLRTAHVHRHRGRSCLGGEDRDAGGNWDPARRRKRGRCRGCRSGGTRRHRAVLVWNRRWRLLSRSHGERRSDDDRRSGDGASRDASDVLLGQWCTAAVQRRAL